MSKASKQKVIDFLSFLKDNRLISLISVEHDERVSELTYEPANGVSLHYKDREVLQIVEYAQANMHSDAVVIAVDGIEHTLEENISANTLKRFEAFKQFKLPR